MSLHISKTAREGDSTDILYSSVHCPWIYVLFCVLNWATAPVSSSFVD